MKEIDIGYFSSVIDKRLLNDCQEMIRRSAQYIISQLKSDGSVYSPCLSRSIESMLVLKLIDDLDIGSSERIRLKSFLIQICDEPKDIFDNLVPQFLSHQFCSNERPLSIRIPEDFQSHHTANRKSIYFSCICEELGFDKSISLPLDEFDYQSETHQSWTRVTLCALKILHASHTCRLEECGSSEYNFLLEKISNDGLYERNVFCGVLALLALSKFDDTRNECKERAIRLLAHQRSDGGFPFFCVDIDVFATSLSGIALLFSYPLVSQNEREDLEKTISMMAEFISSKQQLNGGWSYSSHVYQTDTDDTSYCIQMLSLYSTRKYRNVLEKGCQFLLDLQGTDGGWPTYVKNQPSECAMTAGALQSLAMNVEFFPEILSTPIIKGVQYLIDCQDVDGAFGRSWSLSKNNGIFRVLNAIEAVENSIEGGKIPNTSNLKIRAMEYLENSRLLDCGWGYFDNSTKPDAISTAYGLLCLNSSLVDWIPCAIELIHGCQKENGLFDAPSDQLGPRPLVWTSPIIGNSVALMGVAKGISILGNFLDEPSDS
jgi:squalene-hopene/tetraprenyl-beta-curcumene cyclase